MLFLASRLMGSPWWLVHSWSCKRGMGDHLVSHTHASPPMSRFKVTSRTLREVTEATKTETHIQNTKRKIQMKTPSKKFKHLNPEGYWQKNIANLAETQRFWNLQRHRDFGRIWQLLPLWSWVLVTDLAWINHRQLAFAEKGSQGTSSEIHHDFHT